MKIILISSVIIELVLGVVLAYNFLEDKKTREDLEVARTTQALVQIQTELKIDSLNLKIYELSRVALYLDSCQQIRTSKTDRAERRGKFVGGILKTIFPAL
jgi:hypothetical protein